jgi:hypothetical protein
VADGGGVTVLGTTTKGNHAVILAVEEEEGRAFLTGLHPEFDESRASWQLVRNAILWTGRSGR